MNLSTGVQGGRSWIDERVKAAREGTGKELVWVKGYTGVAGNKVADNREKDTAMRGQWMSEPSLAIPGGIRHSYPLFDRSTNHTRGAWTAFSSNDPNPGPFPFMIKPKPAAPVTGIYPAPGTDTNMVNSIKACEEPQ